MQAFEKVPLYICTTDEDFTGQIAALLTVSYSHFSRLFLYRINIFLRFSQYQRASERHTLHGKDLAFSQYD